MQLVAATLIFISHYQLVICDDAMAFTEESNWSGGDSERGFAENDRFRMVGTEADLNDYWVEVAIANEPPNLAPWQRVTCVGLNCSTGRIHIMSVTDSKPPISLNFPKGDYSIFVAGSNIGIDQISLGEDDKLTDEQLAERKDLGLFRPYYAGLRPRRPKVLSYQCL